MMYFGVNGMVFSGVNDVFWCKWCILVKMFYFGVNGVFCCSKWCTLQLPPARHLSDRFLSKLCHRSDAFFEGLARKYCSDHLENTENSLDLHGNSDVNGLCKTAPAYHILLCYYVLFIVIYLLLLYFQLFPGLTAHLLTLVGQFWYPLRRDYVMLAG